MTNCNLKNKNSDNIFNNEQILDLQKKVLEKQEPYYYFSYLNMIDSQSYYINSELAYYTKNNDELFQIKEKHKGINNTFTLAIQSINMQVDSSIKLLKKSIQIDFGEVNIVSRRLLLNDYISINDSIEIFNFIKDIKKSKFNSDLEINLIWSLYLTSKGKFKESISNLIHYKNKYKVENYELYSLIAENHISLKNFDEAEFYISASLNLFKNYDYSYYLLALINFEKKDYASAKYNIEKAIKIGNNYYLYNWQLISILKELKSDKELIYKNYRKALTECLNEDFFLIFNEFILILIENKDFDVLKINYDLFKEKLTDGYSKSIYEIVFVFYVENDFMVTQEKYNNLLNNYPEKLNHINSILDYFKIYNLNRIKLNSI